MNYELALGTSDTTYIIAMIRKRNLKSILKPSSIKNIPDQLPSKPTRLFCIKGRRKFPFLSVVLSITLGTAYIVLANDKDPICHNFDHGDVFPIVPNLTSVFNCNSPSGKCEWFYPAKFFNTTCGIGKDYSGAIEYMEQGRNNRTLWLGGPPIVLPYAHLHPDIKPNGNPPGRTIPLPKHTLSMIHIHKTGGTSLVTAFGALGRSANGKRLTSYQPGRKAPTSAANEKINKKRPFQFKSQRNVTGKFLDGAVKYRETWGEKEHTLFGVVRDPAERFISAIGQATGAYGSTNNGIGKMLRDECIKETGRETLRCFVDVMMNNGTWIEVHFTPMAYEISFATMYKDIPVAIFPFDEVPTLMYELNQNPEEKKKDGHKKGYRKSAVLTNLTIDDYDEGTMRDLCQVYEVDVLLLSVIGYSSNCDPFDKFTRYD